MEKNGIYIIKDSFFEKYKDPNLSNNKKEKRPHLYVFSDKNNSEILWVVPLISSPKKIEKIKKELNAENKNYNSFYVIPENKITNRENAFNVGNVFPILKKYIKKSYNYDGKPLQIKNKKLINEINEKVKKNIILNTVNSNRINVFKIKEELIKENKEDLKTKTKKRKPIDNKIEIDTDKQNDEKN